jgi:hypothetical protein
LPWRALQGSPAAPIYSPAPPPWTPLWTLFGPQPPHPPRQTLAPPPPLELGAPRRAAVPPSPLDDFTCTELRIVVKMLAPNRVRSLAP